MRYEMVVCVNWSTPPGRWLLLESGQSTLHIENISQMRTKSRAEWASVSCNR